MKKPFPFLRLLCFFVAIFSLPVGAAENLTLNLNAAASWNLSISNPPFGAPIDTGILSLNTSFSPGTGTNHLNQMYREQNTLAPNTAKNYVLTSFTNGPDALGQSLAMTNLKALMVQIQGNAQIYTCTGITVSNNLSGTNFNVGDVLTIAGAGQTNSPTTFTVTVVSNTVVTNVTLTTAGSYSVQPTTSGNVASGGHGSNCFVNLTFATQIVPATAIFTESDFLAIGTLGSNQSLPFISSIGGATNTTFQLYSGTAGIPGTYLITEGGPTGWPLRSTNCLLTVSNASAANPITYSIIIAGATQ